jgi:phosphatidylserine decarboxylase
MKDALIVSALSLVPRRRGARAMGRVARSRASRWITAAFVKAYGVDLSEAEGELTDYPTLEALFTRTLRDGARPVDDAPEAIVSPVDGTCAWVGPTADGRIALAPGRTLDVGALVGHPLDGEADVVVLYLSPKDYHRVHVPREGEATSWHYVPGTLCPVFPAAVRRIDDLFARNERLVVRCETSEGDLEVVLVGAFGVGRITAAVTDLVTNTGGTAAGARLDPPHRLERAGWLGTFHLGSTVVLVAPPGRWQWSVEVGETVRVGRSIGRRPLRLEG